MVPPASSPAELLAAQQTTAGVHAADALLGYVLGVKLLIKPSKEAVRRLKARLRREWLALRGQPVRVVVGRLNPIIRGWANYYRHVVSKQVFNSLDWWRRCCITRRQGMAKLQSMPRAQIAMASSSNARANRRFIGSSVASS
jgi:hypothetical protein